MTDVHNGDKELLFPIFLQQSKVNSVSYTLNVVVQFHENIFWPPKDWTYMNLTVKLMLYLKII